MNNTFILLGSLSLVVTPKITFQSHVVYGQEPKMYLKKIGISGSQRGDTRLTPLDKMQNPMWSITRVKYAHRSQGDQGGIFRNFCLIFVGGDQGRDRLNMTQYLNMT